MLIRGMKGFGDSIYQRSFVKQLTGEVLLQTPWPELYHDLPNVQFVRPATKLRTQLKNVKRQPAERWLHESQAHASITVGYGHGPILRSMAKCFNLPAAELDLPPLPASPVRGHYAVIRPVTYRKEYPALARNPDPQYIAECASILLAFGITVVSVADIQLGEEEFVGAPPPADICYHHGELDPLQLLALVKGAQLVVGGIGWLLPAAVAAKTPGWFVCGGQGGRNAPELITDPSMNLDRIAFAVPDHFCRCIQMQHNCRKDISEHAARFARWFEKLPVMGT